MNWFRNTRTVIKLMTGFAVMALIMAVIGYEGLSATKSMNGMLNTLYEKHMMGLAHIKESQLQIAMIGRDVRKIVLAVDRDEAEQAAQAVEAHFKDLDESLALGEKTLILDEAKATAAKLRETLIQYKTGLKKTIVLALAGKKDQAIADIAEAGLVGNRMVELGAQLAATKTTVGKQFYDESDALYARTIKLLVTILGVALALALLIGSYIARLISRPLNETVVVLEALAKGDLTKSLQFSTKDEVGQMAGALNQAISRMRTALTEVSETAMGVSSAAEQLASASEELSSGTQQQASSQEETSATMEEISSTVRQNADSARQANQLAAGARDVAVDGGHVVNSAVSAMAEINASSKRIADIITTIDEIAFQTNLLALNAAVEAARAGEQGRGFAVVASEVRNLAQRSATSAKEIKGLIQDSVRKVENGSELVNRSGHTLDEIVTSVKRVTDIVAEIAAASAEQASGIEQVGKAMVQMDQVTQTNSAQTQELSSTAQTLAQHATEMQRLIGRFVLTSESRRAEADVPFRSDFRNAQIKRRRPKSKPDAAGSLQELARATSDSTSVFTEVAPD